MFQEPEKLIAVKTACRRSVYRAARKTGEDGALQEKLDKMGFTATKLKQSSSITIDKYPHQRTIKANGFWLPSMFW